MFEMIMTWGYLVRYRDDEERATRLTVLRIGVSMVAGKVPDCRLPGCQVESRTWLGTLSCGT